MGKLGEQDVESYVAHPAVLAVGGSWVADRVLVRERRFDEIERRARAAAKLVGAARRVAV